MNDIETLQSRAKLATIAAGYASTAKAHLQTALGYASEGRLDIAISDDLNTCIAAADRAIKHAEQCRRRLLRKADRKEAEA